MIPLIDLTPDSCKRRLGRRRQIQMWISCYVATIAGLVGATAILSLAEQRAQSQVDYLLEQVQLDADQQRQASALLADIDHFEKRIARHGRLAWPFTIGDVIASIGDVAPDSITLTSLAITPRTDASRAGRARGAGAAYKVMYIELAGIAPDDLDIAAFVAGLQEHALFSTITVDYARKAQLSGDSAREFGLTCAIALDAEYVRTSSEDES